MKPHRLVNGQVVELTAEEVAARDAEWAANTPPTPEQQAAAGLIASKAAAKAALTSAQDGTAKGLRAVVLVLLDEINALRTAAGLTPRTPAQIKAALASKVDGGAVDAT